MTKRHSQMIKGVAILIMMWHHCFLNGRFNDYAINFWPFTLRQVTLIAAYFKACVSLFAFVSGYGLLLAYESRKGSVSRWLRDRYVKSFRGYWFVVVCAWIVCQAINGRPYKLYQFSKSVLYGVWNMAADFFGIAYFLEKTPPAIMGTWWYMSAVVAFLLLLPLLHLLTERIGPICTMGAILILPRAFGLAPNGTIYYSFLPIFYAGMLFAKYDLFARIDGGVDALSAGRSRKARPAGAFSPLRAALWLAFIALSLLVFRYLDTTIWWGVKWNLMPIFLILFSKEVFPRIAPLNAVLEFLGRHSANIFWIHSFIRGIYMNRTVYLLGERHFLLSILFLLLSALLLSIAVEFVKKLLRYDERIDRLLLSEKQDA